MAISNSSFPTLWKSSPNLAFTTISVQVTNDSHVATIKCQFSVLILLAKFDITDHPSVNTYFTWLLRYHILGFSLTSLARYSQSPLLVPHLPKTQTLKGCRDQTLDLFSKLHTFPGWPHPNSWFLILSRCLCHIYNLQPKFTPELQVHISNWSHNS